MTKQKLIQVRVSDDDISAIDELRKAEPDLPSRSEMVRRLVERASHDAYFPGVRTEAIQRLADQQDD